MVMRIFILILVSSLFLNAEEKSRVKISETTMSISNTGQATLSVKQVIEVSDKRNLGFGEITIWTSDFVSLEKINVNILDEKGKRKKRFKKRHFEESEGGSGLASDSKYFYLDASSVLPIPFVIELEYTKTIHSLFFWPRWDPQEQIPVDKATYTLEVPAKFGFDSYSPIGLEPESIGSESYYWEQTGILEFPDEKSMPSLVYNSHRVLFAPYQYELDGIKGFGGTWSGVADFYSKLAKEQYELDPKSVSDLVIEPCESTLDTIRQVYEYVQRTTRYVAVELGIHGWKPHTSQWVCDNKYGDCKDLATFFISLLDIYGIEAYPVLILTRSGGTNYINFPDNRFNHAIACVPLEGDTLWVDCTYEEAMLDLLPPNDQGCNVVVVGTEGAVMVQTPILPPETNQVIFKGQLKMEESGPTQLVGELLFIGNAAMRERSRMKNATVKEQREALIYLFRESAPGLELTSYSFVDLEQKDNDLTILIEGNIPHLGSNSGNRIFVNLSLPGRIGWSGEHVSRRTHPYDAGLPSIYASEITLSYPESVEIESLPREVNQTTPFGSFSQRYSQDKGQLRMTRKFQDNQWFIPLEEYPEFSKFRQKVKKANKAQAVFIKN